MNDLIFTAVSVPEMRSIIQEELRNFFQGKEPPQSTEASKRLLSLEEACELVNISKSWMYKLTSGNLIPHSKRGKRLYFDRETLVEWSLKNRVKTVEELQEEAQSYRTTKKKEVRHG